MVDPRMMTEPVTPDWTRQPSPARWLAGELRDHLWPWSRQGLQRRGTSRLVQLFGFAFAVIVSACWVLAVRGELGPHGVIAWWTGWSAFEVALRLQAKPYVKEGPWWERRYRRASPMDMVCYVGFKNLLLGAALFFALKSQGFPGAA